MRYPYIPTRMAKIKKKIIENLNTREHTRSLLHSCWERMAISYKANYVAGICTPEHLSREMDTQVDKKSCT